MRLIAGWLAVLIAAPVAAVEVAITPGLWETTLVTGVGGAAQMTDSFKGCVATSPLHIDSIETSGFVCTAGASDKTALQTAIAVECRTPFGVLQGKIEVMVGPSTAHGEGSFSAGGDGALSVTTSFQSTRIGDCVVDDEGLPASLPDLPTGTGPPVAPGGNGGSRLGE